jgi:hypothetical protein
MSSEAPASSLARKRNDACGSEASCGARILPVHSRQMCQTRRGEGLTSFDEVNGLLESSRRNRDGQLVCKVSNPREVLPARVILTKP